MATAPVAAQWRFGLMIVLGLSALLAAASLASSQPKVADEPSQAEKPLDDRAVLMRRKLDHSQRILGGLAEGRFGSVARSARSLQEISEVAAFYNLPTDDYQRFSNEFRRITQTLAERAEANDLDGATLANVQLIMNCVECHKYVRIQMNPPAPPR
ncbi:hypothetical protein [Tautonia marina]|uniref:hypothetical protein n=1 Tax=Tautonia marina TaxID=2653855 RepID=UPI001260E989|nr:hypothetical protein [Tautonia marina]